MMDIIEARRLGVNACIEKIGRQFVMDYCASSTASYSLEPDENNEIICFVGVDDNPSHDKSKPNALVLDSISKFPYQASCSVNLESGDVTILHFSSARDKNNAKSDDNDKASDEYKRWYVAAVRSNLILNYGMSEERATEVIEAYHLREKLRLSSGPLNYTIADTTDDMRKKGFLDGKMW